MTCPCDRYGMTVERRIAPGLSVLPYPVNDFSRLRAAMLASIRDFPALDGWNARGEGDLGVMLLEFFAYMGHTVEFYDWVAANESYLRTAFRQESLAGIVSLTGYQPRPASPAFAELAATATGQRPVLLPAGTQFRSGAFEGSPPQIFEAEGEARLHARANSWTILAPRRTTLAAGSGTYTASYLDVEAARADLEVDDLVLIRTAAGLHGAFTVTAVEEAAQADGTPVKRVTFNRPLNLAKSTSVAAIDLLKPTQTVGLFTVPADPDAPELLIFPPFPLPEYRTFTLDRQRSDLKPGEPIIISYGDDHRWFTVVAVRSTQATLVPAQTVSVTIEVEGSPVSSTSTIPAAKTTVTRLTLDVDYNAPARRAPGFSTRAPVNDRESYEIRYRFLRAARVAAAPIMEIWPDAPLALRPGPDLLVPMPPEPDEPRRYLLADEFGLVYAATGSLDPASGHFFFEETEVWPAPLTPPVTLYGNVFPVRRGETIRGEVIGSGNAALPGLELKLAKAPVAYLPDTTGATERGYRSTVTLWVDGSRWEEVEDLAIAGPDDEVFMLRQTAEQETLVVTGDGTFGRRSPTGSGNLVVNYVFGAGEAAPPAGSISQIATPVEGLSAVINPLAASGGADAEKAEDVKRNAPSVGMLLGRIVSLDDVLAVARSYPGVTAARADWVWHGERQTAAIQVWCIATAGVVEALGAKIRNLSEPGLAVAVELALPVPLRLALQVEIDPRRVASEVEDAVRAHLMDPLTGLLSASHIGIGEPLFRSRIFAAALQVPGILAVPALTRDGTPFNETGITPGAGQYFDVAAGGLVINGRENGNGE
jgi:hypothetical protein